MIEIQRALCIRLFMPRTICQNHLVMTSDPLNRSDMPGQGSTGNVIAALCSFFIPGLGQLLQGRLLMAIVQFCLAAVMWFLLLGWLIHLWSILDAALYKPRN
jgi:TM2 domain-containing membrane protein YozV